MPCCTRGLVVLHEAPQRTCWIAVQQNQQKAKVPCWLSPLKALPELDTQIQHQSMHFRNVINVGYIYTRAKAAASWLGYTNSIAVAT